MVQGDIEYYKGHQRHLQTLGDCLRKDLEDLRKQNSTLKWKKCDLEREVCRLGATADCLRQRVSLNIFHLLWFFFSFLKTIQLSISQAVTLKCFGYCKYTNHQVTPGLLTAEELEDRLACQLNQPRALS
jgi:hypothetical protein